jgi:hypothetical protein
VETRSFHCDLALAKNRQAHKDHFLNLLNGHRYLVFGSSNGRQDVSYCPAKFSSTGQRRHHWSRTPEKISLQLTLDSLMRSFTIQDDKVACNRCRAGANFFTCGITQGRQVILRHITHSSLSEIIEDVWYLMTILRENYHSTSVFAF